MRDLKFGPYPRLLAEMERLDELEKETLAAWKRSSHPVSSFIRRIDMD
jgi:hypothetical protein